MRGVRRPALVLVLVSGAIAGCGADLPVGPQAGAENVRVNRTTAYLQQEEPSIAVDQQGRLYVGWKEMNTPAEANRVALALSLDGGFTWSEPLQMKGLGVDPGQSDPWLVLDASGTVVYAQAHSCAVAVSTSRDGGTSWSPPTNVHDRSGCADKEALASDGNGRLYLAYQNIEPNATAIVLSVSQDGGGSWQPTTVVARSDGRHRLAPVVATQPKGRTYVAWWSRLDGNIEVASSPDFGATWGEPVRVNPVPGSVPSVPNQGHYPMFPPFPSVAVTTSGALFAAWPDHGTGDWDVLVSRSDDGGRTWSAPVGISDDRTGNQWMVRLVADGDGMLHAAWYDGRSGDTHVMYSSSLDGQMWSPSLRVTTQATPGVTNRLGDYLGLAAGPDGVAHLAWTDIRGPDMDIYYAGVSPSRR